MSIKILYLSFLIASFTFLVVGCGKDKAFVINTKEDAGTIESVVYIPAGFRQQPLTSLTTTSGTFVLYGHISIRKGLQTFITNGSHLTWEGSDFHYFIY